MKTITETIKQQHTGNSTTPGSVFIPLYTLATDEHVLIEAHAKVTVVGSPNDAMSSFQGAVCCEGANGSGGVAGGSPTVNSSIAGNVLAPAATILGIAFSGLDAGLILSYASLGTVTVDVEISYSVERL